MIKAKELIIDPEFQRIIPALTEAEFAQLEANILEEGRVRDALIVWNDTIVDGHNRWRIIQKHPGLPFTINEMPFSSRDEAILWMCNNQLGRRNLLPLQIANLSGRRYRTEKKILGSKSFQGNQHTKIPPSENPVVEQNVPPPDWQATAERIGRDLGISHMTVKRNEKFADGLDAAEELSPGISQQILSGELQTTKQKVIAVGQENDPQKRQELIEEIREATDTKRNKPKGSTSPSDDLLESSENSSPALEFRTESQTGGRDVYHSIEAISSAMEQVKEALSLDDVLETLKGAVQSFQATCDFYLEKYPELLTDQIYRKKTIAIMKEMQNYLKNI